MATYEVVGSITGLTTGAHVTDEVLEKEHKALNKEKLLKSGSLRFATGPAVVPQDPNDPTLTSGSPEPLRQDMDRAEADAINHGSTGDSAAKSNPPSGDPGKVRKVGR